SPMNDFTKTLEDMFAFNTRVVRLGLEDLEDKDALHRMRGGEGSSISFLVGHLLASRASALKMVGEDLPEPLGAKAAAQGSEFPKVAQLAREWNEVALRFSEALGKLDAEQVLAPAGGLPVSDQTVRGALMFRAWHESYHVGQIGLIRTELGYAPLRDRLRADIKPEE
ncbi:MAG: DinB family protein, partial [Acidobacteria bacterium]|nr:DinB family protein [Acidobacteriota bacterium]